MVAVPPKEFSEGLNFLCLEKVFLGSMSWYVLETLSFWESDSIVYLDRHAGGRRNDELSGSGSGCLPTSFALPGRSWGCGFG